MSQVEPYMQSNWDWRAAGNFIGGGSGTGLALVAGFAWVAGMPYWPIILLSLVLIGVGLFSVWLEIGKPWRAVNVFFHPETSWMTREAFVSLPLFAIAFLAGLVDFLGSFPGWMELSLVCVTAAIAYFYLFSQSRILMASKGIPAWRDEAIQPLIISTGVAEGCGLVSFFVYLDLINYFWIGVFIIASSLVRIAAWFNYMRRMKDGGAPNRAIRVLKQTEIGLLVLGGLVPLIATGLAMLFGSQFVWLLCLAGAASVLAGWFLKYMIVARASFNQGFALPKLPVRGLGKVKGESKPGWN